MTNYNERVDNIIDDLVEGCEDGRIALGYRYDLGSKAKQALTSLIKELVAEAKPYGKRQFRELIEDAWYEAPTAAAGFGRIEAIHNQFEQNLLKALEEL